MYGSESQFSFLIVCFANGIIRFPKGESSSFLLAVVQAETVPFHKWLGYPNWGGGEREKKESLGGQEHMDRN